MALAIEIIGDEFDAMAGRLMHRLPSKEVDAYVLSPRAFRSRYRNDRVAFVYDCINWPDGQHPTDYQLDILGDFDRGIRRQSIRTPHGAGKTALSAWMTLHFALTRDGEDWKIPTTASAWRQLSVFLWPEIHKWSRMIKWAEQLHREPFNPKTELLDLSIKLGTGEAFAVASDNPALIEGAHADHLLYTFDEAKAIPDKTWDAAEGAFSTGDCYALAISTAGAPIGRFYDIHARKPGYEDWKVRHVTLDDCIRAGRINPEWAEARARQWPRDSAVYQNRVLGEFASSEESGIIPLSWVEAANERWREWEESGKPGDLEVTGADVARSGEDKTVQALRFGEKVIGELRKTSREDTMQTTGRVAGVLQGLGGKAIVDIIGIGAGVFDRLREQGLKVEAFNASEHTDAKDRSGELGFANKRAASWWNLRELLDPANGEGIALPPDDDLTGDLTAPGWKVTSSGKIQVESKDEIKARLGRSPDAGDAVVMAFWREKEPGEFLFIG
jgi:hypothetical protein